MRLRFAPLAVLLLLFAASLPASAQWKWGHPHQPQSGACFFRGPGFSGDYFCLKAGDRWDSMPRGFNDRIVSIRVFGDAHLRVFNDSNFGGMSLLLDRDVDDLRRIPIADNYSKNWGSRISSIAVFTGRDEWEDRYRGRDQRPDHRR